MNAEVQDEAEPLKSDDVSDDRRRSKTMSRKEMARDLRKRRWRWRWRAHARGAHRRIAGLQQPAAPALQAVAEPAHEVVDQAHRKKRRSATLE